MRTHTGGVALSRDQRLVRMAHAAANRIPGSQTTGGWGDEWADQITPADRAEVAAVLRRWADGRRDAARAFEATAAVYDAAAEGLAARAAAEGSGEDGE